MPKMINKLQDFNLSLAELRDIVEDLICQYGDQSKIFIDSGPNNASVGVEVMPKSVYAKGTCAIIKTTEKVEIMGVTSDGHYQVYDHCNHYNWQIKPHQILKIIDYSELY